MLRVYARRCVIDSYFGYISWICTLLRSEDEIWVGDLECKQAAGVDVVGNGRTSTDNDVASSSSPSMTPVGAAAAVV